MVFARKEQQGIEAKEKPNIYLEEMAIKVRQLSPSEVAERFKDKGPNIEKLFPPERTFEINGRVYGVTFKKRFLELHMDPKARDLTVLKAYISLADAAIDKFSSVVENYDRKEFPLVIVSKPKSSHIIASTHTKVGDDPFPSLASVIEVNKSELEKLSNLPKNKLAGLYAATAATLKGIESTVFHEAIHDFRGHYFGSKSENLALLGGFLHDPELNWDDYYLFVALSKALRYENPTKEELEWAGKSKKHIEEWRKIAKILILELNQIFPKIHIPESCSGQIDLATRLHSYYSEVPQEKRDEILRRYIRLPDEKIDQIADDARQKFKLEF